MPAATPTTVSSRARCDGDPPATASPATAQVTDRPSATPRVRAFPVRAFPVRSLPVAAFPVVALPMNL